MLLLGESTCINATPGTAKCIYYNDAFLLEHIRKVVLAVLKRLQRQLYDKIEELHKMVSFIYLDRVTVYSSI